MKLVLTRGEAVRQPALQYLELRKGKMAHPTRFERVTFAFGGNMASSAKKRKEPPMPAYLSVNAKQFEFLLRRSYSSPRHSFRPRAYVVLTREETVGSEEAHA